MTCDDARDLFSALVDDALSPEERDALDEHLAVCPDCRRELEGFQRTVSLVRAAPPVRAPAGFVDRVLVVARPAPWYQRLARRLFFPLPVKLPLETAAIVLVTFLAVHLYRETPDLQQASRAAAPPPAVSEAPPPSRPLAAPPTPASPPVSPPLSASGRSSVPGSAETAAKSRQENADRLQRDEGAQVSRATPPDLQKREESKGALKDDARSTREGRADLESPPPPERFESSKVPEQRVTDEAKSKSAAPPAAAAPSAASRMAALTAADVAGRLVAPDRAAAESALADLVARLGGAVLARHTENEATVVELQVPRASYSALLEGFARIGRFTLERAAGDLPDQVRISLRLTA
jgi:putative zinc finger protein